jgi:hypothetical protein
MVSGGGRKRSPEGWRASALSADADEIARHARQKRDWDDGNAQAAITTRLFDTVG